jgi:hypothetical protein
MRIRSAAKPALILAVAVALAACTQEQSQASADLCASLDVFGVALQDFQDLDPASASVEDVEAAREDIDAALEDVTAAASGVSEADEAALETAWGELADDLENIPDDEAIADVLAGLQATAGEVRGVYQEMLDGSGCA